MCKIQLKLSLEKIDIRLKDGYLNLKMRLICSELQKLVFAKKSLAGSAKMLIDSESIIKSWKKLKEILRDEFIDKINSAQIHDILVRRRLKRDETVQKYYYVIKEIAARGNGEIVFVLEKTKYIHWVA